MSFSPPPNFFWFPYKIFRSTSTIFPELLSSPRKFLPQDPFYQNHAASRWCCTHPLHRSSARTTGLPVGYLFLIKERGPGDSSRALFIPDCWRSLNPLKGSLNHPKKVTNWITRVIQSFFWWMIPGSVEVILPFLNLFQKITSRWWFQTFFISPLFGEDEPILTNIFQRGWNHQLDFIITRKSDTIGRQFFFSVFFFFSKKKEKKTG